VLPTPHVLLSTYLPILIVKIETNLSKSTVRGETLETAHLHNLCLKGRKSSAEHDEDFSQIKAFITSQKILGLHDFQEP
jgi:hypothetical protein